MKFYSVIIIMVFFLSVLWAQEEKSLNKTFEGIEKIEINLVLGSCEITRGNDQKISIKLTYTHSEDYFEPVLRQVSNRLTVEEKFRGKNGEGDSYWILEIPDGMDIEFESATGNLFMTGVEAELDGSSGTGNIEISNASGEFDLSSGTGNIEVKDSKGDFELNSGTGKVILEMCEGDFDANSGTGKVEASKIKLRYSGEFNSGTGEVMVKSPSGGDFTLEVNSGTNDAVLDMRGQKLTGYFELKTKKGAGKIRSSEKFDKEEEYKESGSTYLKKSFTRGSADPKFYISSGTGDAELKH
jgi:hypothetical protein